MSQKVFKSPLEQAQKIVKTPSTVSELEDYILNDRNYKGPVHSEVDWDSSFRGFENNTDAATFGDYIKNALGLEYEIHGDRGGGSRVLFKNLKDDFNY